MSKIVDTEEIKETLDHIKSVLAGMSVELKQLREDFEKQRTAILMPRTDYVVHQYAPPPALNPYEQGRPMCGAR